MPKTVLIVDDHPSFRSSAAQLLEAEGYDVVGQAESGIEGLTMARALHPDIVLVDVRLPDIDGFDVAARMTGTDDPPSVILTSSHDLTELAPLVRRSGARGFVPKPELCHSTLAAILP